MAVTTYIQDAAGDLIDEIQIRPYLQWDGSVAEILEKLVILPGLSHEARIGGINLLEAKGLICDIDDMRLLAEMFEYGADRRGIDRAAGLIAQLMCVGLMHHHPWGLVVTEHGKCAACPGGEARMHAAATFFWWWVKDAPGGV